MVEFQGGFYEAMDGGEHGPPFAEKCGVGKARTAKYLRHFPCQKDLNHVIQIWGLQLRPDPDPSPVLDEFHLLLAGLDIGQIQPVPGQLVACRLFDGSPECRNDGVDLLDYCVGGNVGLGLDVPKGAFGALEGLHHVDDLVEAIGSTDDKEGQDGFVVWVCLVPDPIGDQDAMKPVVGLQDKGGLVVVWRRLGMSGFGHGETIGEECWGRKTGEEF